MIHFFFSKLAKIMSKHDVHDLNILLSMPQLNHAIMIILIMKAMTIIILS
jgi:hypothetical protein